MKTENKTSTRIASYIVLVIVKKDPCPQFHQISSYYNTQNKYFMHFIFMYIWVKAC